MRSFGTQLRQSTGINVMVRFGLNARERFQPVVENPTSLKEVNNSPTPESIEESSQTSNETNTTPPVESTPIQIPPGNNQPSTGEAISEQKSNSNNLLLASLIIGIAIIVGFVILAGVMRKREI